MKLTDFKMRSIVVTGASGFVGSNLVRYFLKKNIRIFIIVREGTKLSHLSDVIDKVEVLRYDNKINKLISFLKKVKPDCVFHLASNFIAEHQSSQIDSLVQSNVLFGLHLLEAMKESGVKKIINTGTSWQHYNNEDYNPVCLYAATKQAFESLLEYYVKAERFESITLKLYDTYGETDTRPKLINLLHKFADEGTELKMSPGAQELSLVHVLDVCEAFFIAWELLDSKSHKKRVYSVCGEKYQLRKVIELFENVTGKKIKIDWGGKNYRAREVMEVWSNGTQLPKWKQSISLEEGLTLFEN